MKICNIVNVYTFRSHNIRASSKGFFLLFLGITLPLAVIMNFASSLFSDKLIIDLVGKTGFDYFKMCLVSWFPIAETLKSGTKLAFYYLGNKEDRGTTIPNELYHTIQQKNLFEWTCHFLKLAIYIRN